MFIRRHRTDAGTREPSRAPHSTTAVASAITPGPRTELCDAYALPSAASDASPVLLPRNGTAPCWHHTAVVHVRPHAAWGVHDEPVEPPVLEAELSPVARPLTSPLATAAAAASYFPRRSNYAGPPSAPAPHLASATQPESLKRVEGVLPLNPAAVLARADGHGLAQPHAYVNTAVPHAYAAQMTPPHVSSLVPASPGESRRSTSPLGNVTADTAGGAEEALVVRTAAGASDVCRPLLLQPTSIDSSATAAQASAAPPNVTTVSALGRTLAAAASALTAAAQREREQEAARVRLWQTERARTLDRDTAVRTLLELAVTEKGLLMDAFSSGIVALAGVMDECAALRRREELRLRQSEVDAELAAERETRRKAALYREHVAAAQDRSAAEEDHTRALQESEAQLQRLRAQLASAAQHAQETEARLEEQDRAHTRAMVGVSATMTEQTMELRALQRAHGQATERWLTAMTLYEGMRRHIAAVLLQRSTSGNSTERIRRVPVRTHHEPSSQRAAHVSATPAERGFIEETLESAHIRIAASAALESANGPHSDSGAAAGKGEPATALEVLLARTKSDSILGGSALLAGSVPSTPPPHLASNGPPTLRASLSAEVASPARQPSPPTAPGGLSSPPGTPLQEPVTAAVADVRELDGSTPLAGASPDPAEPSPAWGADQGDGTSAEAQAPVRAAADSSGSGERRGSSFLPSRLNSVASTRRGSWVEAASGQVPVEPCDAQDAAADTIGEPPIAVTTAAATAHEVAGGLPPLLMPVVDSRRSSDATAPLSASLDSGSGGGGGGLAGVFAALEVVAAAAVQRECARLLDAVALDCEKGVAPASARELMRTGAVKPLRTNGTAADGSGTRSAPHLSVSNDSPGLLPSVTAQRCMRVAEVAHSMARLLSRLLPRLRKVAASLQQRVALLEAKDWNKTMAHQFIAADHVAAVQRLVADVEQLLRAGAKAAAPS